MNIYNIIILLLHFSIVQMLEAIHYLYIVYIMFHPAEQFCPAERFCSAERFCRSIIFPIEKVILTAYYIIILANHYIYYFR